MTRLSQFKWVPKREGMAIAASILTPAVRFERDECLDLPDVMIETHDVELSPAQKKAYDELKKTLKTQVGAGQINAINEATLRMKLIQIACGAVYGEEHEVHKIDCASRLAVLEDIIEQSSHKLLIFAPLTSVINLLYTELRKRYTVEKVTGEVSAKRRNEIFKAFQDEANPRIIVADAGCMAHGLTLTAADTTVWFGPTDKPEIYQQANKRMDRPGQKNSMLIVRLAATATEREIYRRLDSREKMQGLILNMIKEGTE
jgi:SNF2 family DNA or RNA helicase